ncbi:MAG: universal stress protein [Gammaproteobacteria bacterium]|jgi:universal stress protein A|nr:universal stress protein [Gammaproteobacteria bacterium]MBT4145357.1 universal stress protein [Gammaproteobacteria bacterium]MBT5221942.1 universal stress protein [Gammaproteobacteria bacterium]MBT5825220.1 universal stress protein [Gammaproteobacteria bacterium]MBT5966949.1 universal stress protein [Gammaproteobacteria bacterium]
MNNYQHILLAVDFSEHGDYIAQKARYLAGKYQAKLSIIHIIDNLPITDAAYGPVIPFDMDLNEELMDAAKKRLAELGKQLSIPEDRQFLEMGSTKLEIVATAEEQHVDLIVLGSHGRHGLALLLGSTANGVLHHAKCDVLAVRLKDN